MHLSTHSTTVPVYTIAGASSARPLPEWLARKRKRSLKKDAEYANRVELLQDFEFEEASQCVRVSDDGDWVMSTGTYKPQQHVHYLPHLSLSYARHTNSLNETFILLSSDYTKSLHLQTDRFLEFHTAGGLHHTARIPRYGRDLIYNKRSAEALVPTVGVNADGYGEVFRLNLEVGRFMKGYEIDVGGDDFESLGGGALQGGIRAGSVNCAAIAEDSHGLQAFGTSLGTVEFWDSRSRNRVSALGSPAATVVDPGLDPRPGVSALAFHPSGLNLATGNSNGIVHTYDLRSPVPLLQKDQGYGSPIQTLKYLASSSRANALSEEKLLSADKKCIKIFDAQTGNLWTSVEPAVDLNCVEHVPDSGMLLTANEGRQQHAFLIPSLGPAPKWCAFLDNMVEEMAEDDETDPNGFNASRTKAGEVYDNYKFVNLKELRDLNLDHLVGTTSVLRPYMHGYFVPQRLYEQARLLSNPDTAADQRQKSIQQKIDKERESRIRGNKKVAVKVNRRLAEKLAAREDANERRKAERLLKKEDNKRQELDEEPAEADAETKEAEEAPKKARNDLMADDRFKRLFEDRDFEIDETSREFAMHNPSSAPATAVNGETKKRGLTAVEQDELDSARGSSDEDGSGSDSDEAAEQAALRARQRTQTGDAAPGKGRIGSSSYKKAGHISKQQRQPQMQVSSSSRPAQDKQKAKQARSFGDLASTLPNKPAGHRRHGGDGEAVGAKEISFAPAKAQKNGGARQPDRQGGSEGGRGDAKARGFKAKERRSASGNVMRTL